LVTTDVEPITEQIGTYARGVRRRRPKALLLIAACGIALCYFLVSIYRGGDLITYQSYFTEVKKFGLFDGYLFYRSRVGAAEPVYYLITWLVSSLGVEYFAYKVTIASYIFIVSGATLLRFGVPTLVIILFCSTNFYLLALYTELERFSFAVLFLLLAMRARSRGRMISVVLLGILSLGSHFQILILFVAIGLSWVFESILLRGGRRIGANNAIRLILGLVAIACSGAALLSGPISGLIAENIGKKLEYYILTPTIVSLTQALALFPLMLMVSRKRIRDSLIYAVISVAVFLFGGDRLNIFLVMFVLMLAFANNRWKHPLVLPAHAYFTFKGVQFISLVIETGRGYG
jgi:hypothetical protein